MGSKTEMTGDTLAVTQLISVHLGAQVCKNDIMLLVTLDCLKFTKGKKKRRSDNSSTSVFIIGHKILVTHFVCNHDSPGCHYIFILNSFTYLF